jgi:hypothetical protein
MNGAVRVSRCDGSLLQRPSISETQQLAAGNATSADEPPSDRET